MMDLGIKVQTGKALGKDFSVESLRKDGYEAVFCGIGLPEVYTKQVKKKKKDEHNIRFFVIF
jgi:NADPH-dependent glutamate synthase beta subunit-like oxidoreductase